MKSWKELSGEDYQTYFSESLSDNNFINEAEEKLLKQTILSTKRLTERQAKYRPLIMDRNACIINLVVNYGLSLQELVSLNMSHIQFARNTVIVPRENGLTRSVSLTGEDTQQMRNTFILRLIKQGINEDELVSRMGFKTKISLKRYFRYLQQG
ncbi:hypothetical protein OF830_23745 [Bacillus paramycoides]|nr:hypothetical protein [Bacillus paramycoides]